MRHGTQTDATMILTADGESIWKEAEKCWPFALAQRRDKDGWSCLLQDLRTRGVSHIDLLVTDGHDGLLAAVASLFPATPRQRCLVHKQRNVPPCRSQARAARRHHRANGHLEAGEQGERLAQPGREHSPNTRSAIPKPCAASAKMKSIS